MLHYDDPISMYNLGLQNLTLNPSLRLQQETEIIIFFYTSVTGLGDFQSFLTTNLLTKVSQMSRVFFWGGLLGNNFFCKNDVAIFWQLFEKLGYFLFQNLATLLNAFKYEVCKQYFRDKISLTCREILDRSNLIAFNLILLGSHKLNIK